MTNFEIEIKSLKFAGITTVYFIGAFVINFLFALIANYFFTSDWSPFTKLYENRILAFYITIIVFIMLYFGFSCGYKAKSNEDTHENNTVDNSQGTT